MKSNLGFWLQMLGINKLITIVKKFFIKSYFWRDYGIPIFCCLLFLSIIYYKYNVDTPPLGDFVKAYYPAGRLVLEKPDDLYRIAKINVFGFVNIPIIAYLFTPFSLLNLDSAKIVFTVLGILSIFLAGFFLLKLTHVDGWRRTGLFLLLALNGPFYNSIQLGNTTHFVFLLLIGLFFCYQTKRDILSGVLLASAAIVKIPLMFICIYFMLRKRWRAVASFFTILLAFVGFSLLIFGFNLNLTWFNECILAFSGKAIAGYNVQSVDSFLIRLLTNSSLKSWQLIEVGWDFKLIRYLMLSLLIGGTIWILWRLKRPTTLEAENLEFSIFLCLALITSPISWTHYYLFLVLPFALYVGDMLSIPKNWSWQGLILLSIFLVSAPPIKDIWFDNIVFTFLARAVLVPHHFLGGILFLGILLTARWQAAKQKLPPTEKQQLSHRSF